MNKLLALHDKVKYHRYRENIVLYSRHYRRYIEAFDTLLDSFQKEINEAHKTEPTCRNKGQKMIIELENRCFLIDARHKLSYLARCAQEYQASGDYMLEGNIRIIMSQLESTLSSIHEYIAYGTVGFFLRYPDETSMRRIRFVWKGTDYIEQQPTP